MPAEHTPSTSVSESRPHRTALAVGPSMDPDAYEGDFLEAAPDEVRIRLVRTGDSVKLLVFSPNLGWTEKLLEGVDPDAIRGELCG